MVAEWVTHLTTLGVSIGRASRITGAKWRLSAQLLDVRAQRRCILQSAVATGRASEAILEEHADDCHHGQSSVAKLG